MRLPAEPPLTCRARRREGAPRRSLSLIPIEGVPGTGWQMRPHSGVKAMVACLAEMRTMHLGCRVSGLDDREETGVYKVSNYESTSP